MKKALNDPLFPYANELVQPPRWRQMNLWGTRKAGLLLKESFSSVSIKLRKTPLGLRSVNAPMGLTVEGQHTTHKGRSRS